MGYSKINEIRYIFYFFVLPTISVLNKILASDVFNYGDYKSESWHRAKKIREVFMVKISPRTFLST